jgi:hypothetical protein
MKNKVKIPEFIQVVLYILMITIDGIYLGILINTAFGQIDVNLMLLIFLCIFCVYGTYFVFSLPYIKQ